MKERGKPKYGQSILSGIGTKIETIAPAAIAAGAYEVFKNRGGNATKQEQGKRFLSAAQKAAGVASAKPK